MAISSYPNPFGDLANTLASGSPTNQNDWMQRIQQFRQRFGQGGFPTGQNGQMPWGMPREPWGGTGTGQKPPVGQSPFTGTQPPPQMPNMQPQNAPMMPWRVPMPPPPAQAPTQMQGQATGTFTNPNSGQAAPVQLPGQVTAPAPPPQQMTGTLVPPIGNMPTGTMQSPMIAGGTLPQHGTFAPSGTNLPTGTVTGTSQSPLGQQQWATSLLRRTS